MKKMLRRAVEVALLCVGVVSSVVMAKDAAILHLHLIHNLMAASTTLSISILINSTVALIALSTFLHHKFTIPSSSSSSSSSSYTNHHRHNYAEDDGDIMFTTSTPHKHHHHHHHYHHSEEEEEEEVEDIMMPPIDHHQEEEFPAPAPAPAPPIRQPAGSTSHPPPPSPLQHHNHPHSPQLLNALVIITSSTTSESEAQEIKAPEALLVPPLQHPPPPPPPPLLSSEPFAAYDFEPKRQAWALATYSPYSSSSSAAADEDDDHRPAFPTATSNFEGKEAALGSHYEDSIDSTWKAITGLLQGDHEKRKHPQPRQPLRKKKHFKKRATAVRRLDSEEVIPSTARWRELRKALTFNDAVSGSLRGGLIRGNEEDIDKQAEKFIKTGSISSSNKDGGDEEMRLRMRLRRQESNKRFSEMIGGRLSTTSR